MQELYHANGHRFTTLDDALQILFLGTRWSEKIAPAILQLAEEMGKTSPKSDELNGILKSICVVQAYINWHCDLIYKLLTLTMYNHCEPFLAWNYHD